MGIMVYPLLWVVLRIYIINRMDPLKGPLNKGLNMGRGVGPRKDPRVKGPYYYLRV